MKAVYIPIFLVFISVYIKVEAQPPNFLWAKQHGGTSQDYGFSITTDNQGNVYTSGSFWGTVDFDPGPGFFNLTSAGTYDVFVSKLDASGNFLWAKRWGGSSGSGNDAGNSIFIDNNGNVYITGTISYGTIDFDPGPGVYNLLFEGNRHGFVSKLDSLGNFLWARNTGGFTSNSIVVNSVGNVSTTGGFYYTADFDPGPGTFLLSATSDEYSDIFVSTLDANGNFLWAKKMGGGRDDEGLSIALDTDGNLHTTGYFRSTDADFDPGPGIFEMSTAGKFDVFVSKLDASGNFLWAKRWGSSASGDVPGPERGTSITTDASGSVYITGYVRYDDVDFDPGPAVYLLDGFGDDDIFITKLDSDGNFIWASRRGGIYSDQSSGIALDGAGNVYISGNNKVLKLDATGNFVWEGNLGTVWVSSIDVDTYENVYFTGNFIGTNDFDPGNGTYNLTTNGQNDIYVEKLCQLEAPVITGPGSFCQGSSITLTASPAASYIWSTGATTQSIVVSVSGNYAVVVSNPYGCTASSVIKTIIGNTPPPTPVITALGQTTFCAGDSITLLSSTASSYLWNTGATTQGINVSTTGNYTVAVTNTNGCSATSNTISITVNPIITPGVSISASATTICQGQIVTFTANPTNGGSNPTYQWFVNNVLVGTGPVYATSTLTNGAQVTCVMTSNATCASPATATSSPVIISVNQIVTPGVSISASATSICPGQNVTFTPNPTNGGTSPAYQWFVNNELIGTGPTYSTTTLTNGALVYCVMTSNATCVSPATANSNAISITVNQYVAPAVSITATATTICLGQNVTFTPSPINGGNAPTYQWFVNNVLVGTSTTYSTTTLANGAQVYCVMTSNAACASPATATSNSVSITVNPTVIPNVSISATATSICQGDNVTFTPNPTNGGTNPSYQWFVNNVLVGTGSTYSTTTLATGAPQVYCAMTSNVACASPATVNSNTVVVTVNPIVSPDISIAGPLVICSGDDASFTASATNGGTGPTYQWFKNNNLVGTGSTYSTTTLANGDQIYCILTSNAACVSPATATSSTVTTTVLALPNVQITANGPTTFCDGENVTLTANPSGAYSWNTGATTKSIIVTTAGIYTVVVTASNGCSAASAATTVTVNSLPPAPQIFPPGPVTILCEGDSAILTSSFANSYLWNTGANTQDIAVSEVGNYSVVITDLNGCTATSVPTIVTCIVGTKETTAPEHFSVSPNPSSGTFTVSFFLPEAKTVSHRMLNVLGQVVWAGAPIRSEGDYSQIIELGARITPGMYLLETRLDGAVYLWKVAVQ